jgi:hypothetical protein
MTARTKATGWSAYVFGEIGSQELDDFGEAIRSQGISPAAVQSLIEAMADRARRYFGEDTNGEDTHGEDTNGELAALGMLDEADAEMASLQDKRASEHGWRTRASSAGRTVNARTATAFGA